MEQIKQSDVIQYLKSLPANSIDAVVSDPPYGLKFMGKTWDNFDRRDPEEQNLQSVKSFLRTSKGVTFKGGVNFQLWCQLWGHELLRVVKPGAHIMIFSAARTVHRLSVGLEDAGWDIRDILVWAYMNGMPKSFDISKSIDKKFGAEREVIGHKQSGLDRGSGSTVSFEGSKGRDETGLIPITAPVTPDAIKFDGWGTGLKPSWEPIVLARAPISEDTITDNVIKYGTGGINIHNNRLGEHDNDKHYGVGPGTTGGPSEWYVKNTPRDEIKIESGSYPPNFLTVEKNLFGPQADRIFLLHKAQSKERFGFCRDHNEVYCVVDKKSIWKDHSECNVEYHPTVKPLPLIQHLVRLVTPPDGVVLDPFMGTGTTAVAAKIEGFEWRGCDKMAEYVEIGNKRVEEAKTINKLTADARW